MRIIAIGIGGAGCRIVNNLYAIDRNSSRVACVQALAIDVDEETMKQLAALPENARMCFSALEPALPNSPAAERRAAPIDINEIVSRVQNMETGENDAIVFCCGLGGSMVDVAPHIIAALRSSVMEPIFGLVTLPCLAEGKRISGKAADDIEMLSSLLDGIIVFDNETWYKKIKAQKARLPAKDRGFAEKIGLKKTEKPLPPGQAAYHNLNEAIVRRIGLILRAGEFKADGGIDLAEVVLDSGEVLNTMKGMGFITIGYAVEKLPHDPLRFLTRLKPAGIFDEEQKRKASRIVELAKQAIYHEISTPCDLTSAHKALVLIAGPSQELSMKGFMTVRKWIDRSIAGLETRSGDYPVVNTKNVAIIVMLSGLENIPRITELKEIRQQSKSKKRAGPEESSEELPKKDQKVIRDDMITLPAKMGKTLDTGRLTSPHDVPEYSSTFTTVNETIMPADMMEGPQELIHPVTSEQPRQALQGRPVPVPGSAAAGETSRAPAETVSPQRRIIVARTEKEHIPSPLHTLPRHGSRHSGQKTASSDHIPLETPARHPGKEISPLKETERQRIERELRRQRTVAMGETSHKKAAREEKNPAADRETQTVQPGSRQDRTILEIKSPVQGNETVVFRSEKRTVIIGKRKVAAVPQDEPDHFTAEDDDSEKLSSPEPGFPSDSDVMSVEIRDRVLPARDEVFQGKGIREPSVPHARDSTLLHTDLRTKKKESDKRDADETRDYPAGNDPVYIKKRPKSDDKT